MLAPTPPMGWNSWNTFGQNIDEALIRETADAFVTQELLSAGYNYVVIDDFWEADERDSDGRLAAHPAKFPSGIRALADYVHDKGLKFGIYSCAGSRTCGDRPSSFGYEEVDAQTFADWGVDFLKYDFCYMPAGADGPTVYRRMGQALRATGRPILFSMCEWGSNKPWEWAPQAGAQMWRTTGDIEDSWESMARLGFGQKDLERYAGPDHWNDPDMLIVGMHGKGNVAHGGCTDMEYRVHFSLWCLLASPLMIGCDVRNMDQATRDILLNARLIAVNQDPLGRQGYCLGVEWDRFETWAKPMADGSVTVGLFNRGEKDCRRMMAAWEPLGIHDRRTCHVVDLWSGASLGEHTRGVSAVVEAHGVRLLRITPL